MRVCLVRAGLVILLAGNGALPAFAGDGCAKRKSEGRPTEEDMLNALAGRPCGVTEGFHPVYSEPLRRAAPPTPRQLRPAAAALNLAIRFASGSSDPAGDTTIIEALGHALSDASVRNNRFRIEGHTDTVGSAEDNLALSQRRAEAVASILESQYGIDSARLEAVGMGKSELPFPTPDQTPDGRNRRVIVVELSP